jgi:NADH-quinone oxidoreductase subunit M
MAITVMSRLAIIGMIYASLIAIRQDDIKTPGRLFFYCAHRPDVRLTIFSAINETGFPGGDDPDVQPRGQHHRYCGSWWKLIERQFGTRKLSELGGLAQKAPAMAILLPDRCAGQYCTAADQRFCWVSS